MSRFSRFEIIDDDPISDGSFGSSTNPNTDQMTDNNFNQSRGNSNSPQYRSSVLDAPKESFDDFDDDWDSNRPSDPSPSNSTNNASKYVSNSTQKSLSSNESGVELRNSGSVEIPKTSKTGMQLKSFSTSDSSKTETRFNSDFDSSPRQDRDNKLFSNSGNLKFESAIPPMPQIQYEPFSVEAPSHYQNYLYLLKYIHGLKILCGIHLLYTAVAIIFRVWYLMGGLVVAPLGFFAVHKLNRRLILVWAAAFAVDTLAELIGALVMANKPAESGGGILATLIHVAVVLLRSGFTYIIYRFWTKLPDNAGEYFALFTSSVDPEKVDTITP